MVVYFRFVMIRFAHILQHAEKKNNKQTKNKNKHKTINKTKQTNKHTKNKNKKKI